MVILIMNPIRNSIPLDVNIGNKRPREEDKKIDDNKRPRTENTEEMKVEIGDPNCINQVLPKEILAHILRLSGRHCLQRVCKLWRALLGDNLMAKAWLEDIRANLNPRIANRVFDRLHRYKVAYQAEENQKPFQERKHLDEVTQYKALFCLQLQVVQNCFYRLDVSQLAKYLNTNHLGQGKILIENLIQYIQNSRGPFDWKILEIIEEAIEHLENNDISECQPQLIQEADLQVFNWKEKDVICQTIPVFSLMSLPGVNFSPSYVNSWQRLRTSLDWIVKLTALQTLDIDYTSASAQEFSSRPSVLMIPSGISQLTTLRYLNISTIPVYEIPEQMGLCQGLNRLILNAAKLKTIPATFQNLTHLTWLEVSNNPFEHFPISIAHITSLNGLLMQNCQLKQIPTDIGRLSNLILLDVSKNFLTTTERINGLVNLKYLNLSQNKIQSLSEYCAGLAALVVLLLNGNQLTELPNRITYLQNLEKLELSENRFTNLPEEILELTNLKILEIRRNQLTTLSGLLTRLRNLSVLLVERNQLTELPNNFRQLTSLKYLGLLGNPLKSIDPSLRVIFQNLNYLDLNLDLVKATPWIEELDEKTSELTLITDPEKENANFMHKDSHL